MTLLVEGVALNVPAIDGETYKEFRAKVGQLALQIPDRLPDEEKLFQIRAILHEFEMYREGSEKALRERQNAWRSVVTTMLRELLASLGIGNASSGAAPLGAKVAALETAVEVLAWRAELDELLHPAGLSDLSANRSSLKALDRSTANDNAAGLRGGGSAVEHLRRILERGGNGFIALFKLSCLDVINQRFGQEAVQDCLMAVSAFLTSSLNSDDAIYHCNDSTLLAILQGRAHQEMVTAELQRIVSQNRETNVRMGGRLVMLRIPIVFELTPIDRLHDADDLFKLTEKKASQW